MASHPANLIPTLQLHSQLPRQVSVLQRQNYTLPCASAHPKRPRTIPGSLAIHDLIMPGSVATLQLSVPGSLSTLQLDWGDF